MSSSYSVGKCCRRRERIRWSGKCLNRTGGMIIRHPQRCETDEQHSNAGTPSLVAVYGGVAHSGMYQVVPRGLLLVLWKARVKELLYLGSLLFSFE